MYKVLGALFIALFIINFGGMLSSSKVVAFLKLYFVNRKHIEGNFDYTASLHMQ